MNKVKDVTLSSLCDSNYVKPLRMNYTQNGIEKIWDFIKIHDSFECMSCSIISHIWPHFCWNCPDGSTYTHTYPPACTFTAPQSASRPPHCYTYTSVYHASIPEHDQGMKIDTSKYPPESGITLELCAGILDKDLPPEETARIEVLEECGYDVPVSNFERIITYSSMGACGDKQTIFYAEVTDNMKVGEGGGVLEEGEFIEVVEMTIPEAKKYMDKGTVLSPGGLIFALLWFFQNKGTL